MGGLEPWPPFGCEVIDFSTSGFNELILTFPCDNDKSKFGVVPLSRLVSQSAMRCLNQDPNSGLLLFDPHVLNIQRRIRALIEKRHRPSPSSKSPFILDANS